MDAQVESEKIARLPKSNGCRGPPSNTANLCCYHPNSIEHGVTTGSAKCPERSLSPIPRRSTRSSILTESTAASSSDGPGSTPLVAPQPRRSSSVQEGNSSSLSAEGSPPVWTLPAPHWLPPDSKDLAFHFPQIMGEWSASSACPEGGGVAHSSVVDSNSSSSGADIVHGHVQPLSWIVKTGCEENNRDWQPSHAASTSPPDQDPKSTEERPSPREGSSSNDGLQDQRLSPEPSQLGFQEAPHSPSSQGLHPTIRTGETPYEGMGIWGPAEDGGLIAWRELERQSVEGEVEDVYKSSGSSSTSSSSSSLSPPGWRGFSKIGGAMRGRIGGRSIDESSGSSGGWNDIPRVYRTFAVPREVGEGSDGDHARDQPMTTVFALLRSFAAWRGTIDGEPSPVTGGAAERRRPRKPTQHRETRTGRNTSNEMSPGDDDELEVVVQMASARRCASDISFDRPGGKHRKRMLPLRAPPEDHNSESPESSEEAPEMSSAVGPSGDSGGKRYPFDQDGGRISETQTLPENQEQVEGSEATRREVEATGDRASKSVESWWTMAHSWFGGPAVAISSTSSVDEVATWEQRSDSMLLHLFPGLVPSHLHVPLPGHDAHEEMHNRGRSRRSSRSQRRSPSPRPDILLKEVAEDKPAFKEARQGRQSRGDTGQQSEDREISGRHEHHQKRSAFSSLNSRQSYEASGTRTGSKGLMKDKTFASSKGTELSCQDHGVWEAMITQRRFAEGKGGQIEREAEDARRRRLGESTSSSSEDDVLRNAHINLMLKDRKKQHPPQGIAALLDTAEGLLMAEALGTPFESTPWGGASAVISSYMTIKAEQPSSSSQQHPSSRGGTDGTLPQQHAHTEESSASSATDSNDADASDAEERKIRSRQAKK